MPASVWSRWHPADITSAFRAKAGCCIPMCAGPAMPRLRGGEAGLRRPVEPEAARGLRPRPRGSVANASRPEEIGAERSARLIPAYAGLR